jgi:hypothetical protein
MTSLGFKKLTVANWLEPDQVSTIFATISPDGESHTITGNEWGRRILEPKLVEAVPAEIQALFEVARGTLVYGYLFYPIYTLASEQLVRVVEAAVTHKCSVMRAPKSVKKFTHKINWLIEKSAISESERAK